MGNNLNKISNRDQPNDELYTPLSLSKQFIDNMNIAEEESCLDPFYGTGSFFNNFNDNNLNDFCEINLGKDFFNYKISHDWIVSNPPFSQLTQILDHTCNLAVKGFAYVLPSYSLTSSRIKNINLKGFYIDKIIHFSNPKEWRLGFQMMFVIFTKNKNSSFINLESSDFIQKRLI